jgi:hypothetical protein
MATPPALKFNLHSPAGDIFFFVTPPTLVEKVFPPGHYALLGASYIAGALLQALWPPRTYKFIVYRAG